MSAGPAPRALRADELDAVAALHARCFPDEPWNRTDLALILAAPGSLGLAVERRAGGLAGFLLLRRTAGEAEILTIGVAPEDRRSGLASRLIESGLTALLAEGITQVFLEVGADNPAAEALYRRFGFRAVGRRPRYYRRGADALVLRLDLPATTTPPRAG